jgi:hypothetical protein
MRARKRRITVTIDAELLRAAEAAVRGGRAESLSAWVNLALDQRAKEEKRLEAMDAAIAAYEAEHGKFTEEELEEQRRANRRNAIHVRSSRRPKRRPAA